MRVSRKNIMSVTVHSYCGNKWAYVVQVRDGNTFYNISYTDNHPYKDYTKVPKCVLQFVENGVVRQAGVYYKGSTIVKTYTAA